MVATFHLPFPLSGTKNQIWKSWSRKWYKIIIVNNTSSLSFSFWVIFVTYNIGIYICILSIKLDTFILFLLSSINAFYALHAKNFEIWKNILWNWWVNCSIAQSIEWCDILGVYSKSIFPFMQYFFLSRRLGLLQSPCFLLITEPVRLDTSDKPTLGFFLKIASSSWIILSISLDELNLIDWLLKSWWWIFLK